ncbi:hypothetical protein GCM10007276_17530 [Agaricicola taiwanensis]|uniref:Tetratricopeptide repeat protein n=1 Tax=Agaricicola taiwanensis TaxID=591372 RepID=A0A8J2VNR9_9RHOB|nr:hypothetical protein [Agaricicola taiwanensis]GGE40680.1 hypothetical protein GCM10007276_17530 [Agaricicola taiwanensis]
MPTIMSAQLRKWKPGEWLLAALTLLFAFTVTTAAASEATVEAKEESGFGRVIMSFDMLPAFDARITTGVLVVTFADSIEVSLDAVVAGMPNYVTAARRDPDGKAVRMALTRPLTVNTMQAGEKLFIDFLPAGWSGYPPGLPREVIADLNKKAREARQAAADIRRLKQRDYQPLTVQVGTNPTFTRLMFTTDPAVKVTHDRSGEKVVLNFDVPVEFDAREALGQMPEEVKNLASRTTADGLVISFDLDPTYDLRAFREDSSYVLDLVPPDSSSQAPAPLAVSALPQDAAVPPAAPGLTSAPAAERSPPIATQGAPAVPMPVARPAQRASAPASQETAPEPAAQAAAPEPETTEAAKPPAAQAPREEPVAAVEAPAMVAEENKEATDKPAVPSVSVEAAPPAAATPSVRRVRDALEIVLPFPQRPAAAVFMRDSTLWMVFDSNHAFDLGFLLDDSSGLISNVEQSATGGTQIARLTVTEPRLISVIPEGDTWVVALGETVVDPSRPIYLSPGFAADGRASVRTTLEGMGGVRWLEDPIVGDRLAVLTLQGPGRGIVRPQNFVEFRALATAHGVAIQPMADDVTVTAGLADLTITRDGGLTLSSWDSPTREQPVPYVSRAPELNAGPFQAASWEAARKRPYREGAAEAMRVAASAGPSEQAAARLALARFEFAHGNAAEAKAVLEVMRDGKEEPDERADTSLMYAAALIELGRNEEGLKILDRGGIADLRQAQLWRSVAEAGLGRLSRSREAYRKGEPALSAMPTDLQVRFRETAARIAIDARDYSTAAIELDAIDALNPADGGFGRALLRARIADGLGQAGLALESYRAVQGGDDEIAAAEARYRATKLRIDRGEISQADAIRELELMSVAWRGDVVEAEVLASLGELYTAENRWRDAFGVMRTAINVHPDAEITRNLQQTMSDRFAGIFLGDASRIDTLDALALFLDFKELTPPGRRGDEIIRRLADRMVDVDLLTEAADLLEYQINNRLAGAAKAQVGARAAVVHLLNQKPARAYRVLQATRLAGLPSELRRSRMLLEAKALAEIGRGDVAVELVDTLDGNDALLMKADILWRGRKWQEAGEALELLVGTRWRDNTPLTDEERMQVLRSGIAYAMSEDSLGLERLRVKFAALMANSPDGRAFDTITAPIEARGAAFTEIARAIAATDTFTAFLEEYRKRHPDEAGPVPSVAPSPQPQPLPEAMDTTPAPETEQTAARS